MPTQRDEPRPLPPLTELQREHFRGLWKAYSEGRGKLEPPWVVAVRFKDRDDKSVIAAVIAVHPVSGEPWLVRGVLRTTDAAPALTRVSVEHLTDSAVEVTSAVLHRIPAATVRDGARAWLLPQEVIADVPETGWNITPEQKRWARRVSAEAKKKPLTRGRKGYPREHYQDLANRAVKLQAEGHRDVVARLAAEEDKPYQTVRDQIYRARELGFLQPATKQGRADFRPGPNLYPKEE
jgi:hypothetical protein